MVARIIDDEDADRFHLAPPRQAVDGLAVALEGGIAHALGMADIEAAVRRQVGAEAAATASPASASSK